ncbi:hypothetical protein DPEC_G00184340 [Dallia pectoralis]|uniref:Uncharacterized protein n=1 Tax=Dallia pectoralis TaxID=75939 RepID=A0ACC2GBF6_DALPE|nr:hypothetical protein DPEC_G00184340 [Dallia pectoralis]
MMSSLPPNAAKQFIHRIFTQATPLPSSNQRARFPSGSRHHQGITLQKNRPERSEMLVNQPSRSILCCNDSRRFHRYKDIP